MKKAFLSLIAMIAVMSCAQATVEKSETTDEAQKKHEEQAGGDAASAKNDGENSEDAAK